MSTTPVNQKVLQELSDGLRAVQCSPEPATAATPVATQVVTEESAPAEGSTPAPPKKSNRQAAAKSATPAQETPPVEG